MAIKAPEFIQEAESSWEITTEAVETPEFTVQKGDILVAYCIMENSSGGASEELNCSGGGFTWTKRQGSNTASNCMVYVYTTEATEAKSFKVKSEKKNSNAGYHHGVNCLTFRKSKGIGASAVTHTTGAPSLAITTEKEHSAVVMANADWEALNGSTRTYREGAGTFTEKTYNFNSAQMTAYGGYYADASAAGAKTVGLTKPTGQKYTIIAVEVLGEEESGGKTVTGKATISGTSTITAKGLHTGVGKATISGTGSLAANGTRTTFGKATISGTGSLAANGTRTTFGKASIAGTGSLSAAGRRGVSGKATIAGTGSISADGLHTGVGRATIAGTGSLSADGTRTTFGKANIEGTGSLSAAGVVQHEGEEELPQQQFFLGRPHIVEPGTKAQLFLATRKRLRKIARTLTFKRRWR